MISEAQNSDIEEMPTYKEVKKVVFSFNGESVGELDGFTSLFYQTYWEIIGQGPFSVELHYQDSLHTLTWFWYQIRIWITTFSAMRPIRLSNFVNKIFIFQTDSWKTSRWIREYYFSKSSWISGGKKYNWEYTTDTGNYLQKSD